MAASDLTCFFDITCDDMTQHDCTGDDIACHEHALYLVVEGDVVCCDMIKGWYKMRSDVGLHDMI